MSFTDALVPERTFDFYQPNFTTWEGIFSWFNKEWKNWFGEYFTDLPIGETTIGEFTLEQNFTWETTTHTFFNEWQFFDVLDYISYINSFATPEFITVALIFNFLQSLILTVFSELTWPTQHFNRKNTIGFKAYRLRTFTETMLKLRNYTGLYRVMHSALFKHYL